jgi:antitoxin component YwqK of YwqJK toxin-antitoxin module
MKNTALILSLFICLGAIKAQEADTFYLSTSVSSNDTIVFKRIIQFDNNEGLYHVRDYYPNGQIQMEGTYSSFDKNIKEESLSCNYKTNTKEGEFKVWYKNGQIESKTNFFHGLSHGLHEYWYLNGQRESVENYLNGQANGNVTYWDTSGTNENKLTFKQGLNQNPKDTNYHYISYTPEEYNEDTIKKWPLIIYLHGGSGRGSDTIRLYCCGIPDQIWRGRKFPFIIVAPQCPTHLRWSTDNWFENFFKEVTTKYRVDTNKVYLTGVSLGGSGTWYLAIKYPEIFAAIAPISGFTRNIEYIMNNTDKLIKTPIWAFHGRSDKVVQFEDTEWIINRLEGKNKDLKFTAKPGVGHWMDWLVYPDQELYDWFLKHDKRNKNKN